MSRIRIMLIDDIQANLEWARALSQVAKSELTLEVVKEAKSGQEAIKYLECSEIRPDVVLMDIEFKESPRLNGLDAAKIIRDRYPTIIILIVSAHDDIAYVRQAFQSGAQGYFLRDGGQGIAELCQAIGEVWKRQYFVSPRILERLIEIVKVAGDGTGRLGLTDQQLEVARLYAKGKNSSEIAEKLDIAMKTAENHITKVRKKLNASSPQEVKERLMLGLTDQQFKVAWLYAKGRHTHKIADELHIAVGDVEADIKEVLKKLNASSPEEVKQRLMENGLLPSE